MTSLVLPLMVTAIASLLVTPLARRAAWRWGALDHADGQRKLHGNPVPHLGGVALFAALTIGALSGCGTLADPGAMPLPLALLLSAATICLVGWLDDRHRLRVRWKLLGQVLATLPLISSGHAIERIECVGFVFDLGWWSIPISIGWFVAGANAMNFIDGADGLAATIGLVIAAATALLSDRLGNPEAAMLAVVLAGGLGGFLFYNWQPATIYLGDAGSMTVGLWLAAVTAEGSRTPQLGSRLIVLVALLAVPLTDVALAVVRRLLNGKRFWLADRGHIHHGLLDRGFSVSRVVATLAAISALAGIIAFAAAVHGRELVAWTSLAALGIAAIRFDLAGAAEFELLGQVLARRMLDAVSTVSVGEKVRHSPRSAQLEKLPIPTAWAMFLADMDEREVAELELTIAGEDGFRHQWRPASAPSENAVMWSCDVVVHGPSGKNCRLRASAREGAATEPLNWLSLSDTLRVYAGHWVNHADALANAVGRDTPRDLTSEPITGDDLAKAA